MSEEKVETPAEEVVETPVEETAVNVTEEVVKPVEAIEEPTAITIPKEEVTGPGLGNVADGAIGSTKVKAKPKTVVEKNEKPVTDKVAVISPRNISWDEVGKLARGVNLVSAKDADIWIAKGFARLATPEEVAKEYGI